MSKMTKMCPQLLLVIICVSLQQVTCVVNSGQTKSVEEPTKTVVSETKEETEKSKGTTPDLVAESSETANRREAPTLLDTHYGTPQLNLPIPVYGIPNAPSNNVVYPAPPPDVPPPPPPPQIAPAPLYGVPSISQSYGAPIKGFGSIKYGAPLYNVPKPLYGPPKFQYSNKPLKLKFPSKNYGYRPPKPVYGPPANKFNFNYNFNSLNSNLYSGVSSLNHQYGAPIAQPQYVAPALTVQYGLPDKSFGFASVGSYGPPQPSSNPKPPHPGVPAPPTPPDIKYDGWQPIPGLISKRPESVEYVTGEGSGYHDLAPPPLNNHIGDVYGAPAVSVDVGHSDASYLGSKGVSDSYSAPLGTVTGSGGVVTSSGDEAHGGAHSSSSHGLNIDIVQGGQQDLQGVKSVVYDISPPSSSHIDISTNYGPPQINIQPTYTNGYKDSGIGLVPPSGIYGAPPSTQYGAPLFNKSPKSGLYSNTKSFHSSSHSYLPPPPSQTYGAVSFQNVAHGSSTAGLSIEGANALPLTSYNVPLGTIDGAYGLPSANTDLTVSLDYSHPPVTIDLTDGKQTHDCYKQQGQVPTLTYGPASIDSYTSSLSGLTTNLANGHVQTIVPQAQYGAPDLIHSASVKSETKSNSIADSSEEAHGKVYGKSVAASFGPNSELLESQSIDLNNIPLQGNLGSYTLQIQSAEGGTSQVPHGQVLNEGLLQSILQAIEQPGQQAAKYPIVLKPSIEQGSFSINATESNDNQAASEIKEIIVDAPKDTTDNNNAENEDPLQVLDSNIALYYRKSDDATKTDIVEEKENSVDEK